MKCASLHDYGNAEQFRIEDVEAPQPAPGQVLVKVAGAAVNPVDSKLRQGFLKDWMPLNFPSVLGGDFSGTIIAVGQGVSESRIGERVMGMVNADGGGAYAEQMVVEAAQAVPVPESVDLVDAAALPMGVMTGYQLIEEGLDVQIGEVVLVTGAGGSVGRAAVYAAAERGAKVIAGVRSKPLTPVAGATATVDLSDDAAVAAAGPFDCVADTSGGASAEAMFVHLRPGGRFASVVFPQPMAPDGAGEVIAVIVNQDASRLSRFASALASGKAELPAPERFPLANVADAHRRLDAGGAGRKLVLTP